ncbi:MAG: exonuclease SbcCD subunit D C-terminal domain-containing protein [Phaeodactylibacter sp.]|nr:exonuclease SbcCD subunit D C-terminal domain-containing protein [Phaeodactylibacter sp.]
MRFLHTSDWHLGQKFIFKDREEEHQLALDWLADLIKTEQVECLLIAGDIFDIGNPPNYARTMYFKFLAGLLQSPCRHVVIIGGNHDSPSMLDAPKTLLEVLNVHVIGSATGNLEDERIRLHNEKGALEAVIGAVPFLRDRDIRSSLPGESGEERIRRIREGIVQHYAEIGELVAQVGDGKIPRIAMGHLYAAGSIASDKQDNIYLGDTANIKAEAFPALFDYVALGHIHRAQKIGEARHIRYSGSIIPLSFSETKDEKVVTIFDFEKDELKDLREVPVPVTRRLKTIEGDLAAVEEKLEQFKVRHQDDPLTPWVEVILQEKQPKPNIHSYLSTFCSEIGLELLKLRLLREKQDRGKASMAVDLDELTPEEVFLQKCKEDGYSKPQIAALQMTFKELLDWTQNQEEQS